MKKFKDLELEEQLELCRALLCGETIEQWRETIERWAAPSPGPEASTPRGLWTHVPFPPFLSQGGLCFYGERIYRVKRGHVEVIE